MISIYSKYIYTLCLTLHFVGVWINAVRRLEHQEDDQISDGEKSGLFQVQECVSSL